MALSHVKSNTIGDFTGTVTVMNSTGGTQTAAATDLVRPSDWNSAHNFFQTISGNTAGQSTASGTNLVIGGTNGATVSLSTAAGAATLWVGNPVKSGYAPYGPGAESVAGQHGAGTLFIAQMTNAPAFQHDRLVMPLQLSNASNSSGSFTLSVSVGVFTRNGNSLSLVNSTSGSFNASGSGTVGSYSLWGGIKAMTIPWTSTREAGDYWVGIWSRTTTGGAAGQTINQMLASQPNSSYSGILGVASNATDQFILGQGRYSVSFSTAMPGNVPISEIQANSSIMQRPPLFYFASSTV